MIKYIIIDDEPLAHELIEQFCGILPHLQLEKNCYNALEAMQYLNENSVDFMFLDLNMPKLKGFDFLRTLSNPPKVIVTTAYKEYALEGFELNVVDYLLKPFSFERLIKAVNLAIEKPKVLLKPTTEPTIKEQRFFIKGDKKHHQVLSSDILYIEAYGNYCKIYFKERMILSHEKISSLEISLDSNSFIRVHKSFIVSKDKINTISGNRIHILEHEIPIGQTYKTTVNELL
ncbi:MAG: DNA-binding response regulator [Flavobacteriaceae bacterium]|nr:MAG: DNA-binding response regulator [Flavobacteriaceae bacterium]